MTTEPAPETLRDLILLALDRLDTPYLTVLERIAQDAGHRIVHTTLAQIYKGTYNSVPSKRTLEAIAFLAGVPYARAHQAAGLGPVQSSFAKTLPRHVDRLTPRQREAVLVHIRSYLEETRATTPTTGSEAP